MAPIPVLACGKSVDIAKTVIDIVHPDYEVIHVVLNAQQGAIDIPRILSGAHPTDHTSNVGTQNYSKIPVAVVVGGGFDDADFKLMRDACDGEGVKTVPWLRHDRSTLTGPPSKEEMAAFAKNSAERVKKLMVDLKVGMEGGTSDGVHLF
ncbi:hypothetical protein BDV95DRAFT_205159 [Massariosphaeria phaeospora]|uniref:Uncharacterized protein n=1 Tax=Massariosphaeria phaeospora TaxID=100035 RepID=A0A7C8HZT4_9PLEO|nr:hypothetical protein BDV95DRAFT_205159 [Massariosphaeria phaeospora]